ncbi:MAG TPA: hypothetical protein VF902_08725, partial [Coriobacteriia bacterium]
AGPRVTPFTVSPPSFETGTAGRKSRGDIVFAIDEPADVVLAAISARGDEYPVAAMPGLDAGKHGLAWDGAVRSADGGRAYLPSGAYRLRATATDAGGNVGHAETGFSVRSADSLAPSVENVSVSPPTISPDSDGVRDAATISFDLLERADVVIFVRDTRGRRYDIFGAPGMATGHHEVKWNGIGFARTAGEQVVLPNGTFDLCVEATDPAGNVARRQGVVHIVGTGRRPLAVTGVSFAPRYASLEEQGRSLRIGYTLTRRADVVISLRSLTGRRYFIGAFPNQTPGARSLVWDGTAYDPATGRRSRVADGTYVYLIEAVSGTSPAVTASGRVSIDLQGPR